MSKNDNVPWWEEKYGFFGRFYMEGDDSEEGYLSNKSQTLRQRTKEEADGLVKLLNLPSGSKILDIPCGYGRHSLALAKKGFAVIGSDINTYHLESARKTATKESSGACFFKENMIHITYKEKFDAVINMFYSFGFFDKEKDNLRVLQNFYDALKPGGKFLMHTDVNIPRILTGHYKHNEVRTLKSGKKLKIIDNYTSHTKRINGSWIVIDKKGNERQKEYSVRVYTKKEFITLCKNIGFKSCKVFSDWSGKPYCPESEDMIIIATK